MVRASSCATISICIDEDRSQWMLWEELPTFTATAIWAARLVRGCRLRLNMATVLRPRDPFTLMLRHQCSSTHAPYLHGQATDSLLIAAVGAIRTARRYGLEPRRLRRSEFWLYHRLYLYPLSGRSLVLPLCTLPCLPCFSWALYKLYFGREHTYSC